VLRAGCLCAGSFRQGHSNTSLHHYGAERINHMVPKSPPQGLDKLLPGRRKRRFSATQ
jgi:hypothetical protein